MSDVHKELRRMTKCWEKADDEVRRLHKANASMADSLDDCCASLNEANGEITKLRKVVDEARTISFPWNNLAEALRELDKEPTPAVKPKRGCSCDSAGSFGCASPYCEYRSEEKTDG